MTTTLIDIHNVIMPFGNDFKDTFINNIDNMFENLIIHDNIIFNTYIFNYITFKNNDNDFQDKTIKCIKKHFISYLRKQQIFFRDCNKKNKFTLDNVNLFINTFYKLLIRVNNMIIHFNKNNIY